MSVVAACDVGERLVGAVSNDVGLGRGLTAACTHADGCAVSDRAVAEVAPSVVAFRLYGEPVEHELGQEGD